MNNLVNSALSYVCCHVMERLDSDDKLFAPSRAITQLALGIISGFTVAYCIKMAKDAGEQISVHYNIELWVLESSSCEYDSRKEAGNRILNAYLSRSPELDLSNLGLTSLPRSIFALSRLKTLKLQGNYLQG